MVVRSSACFRQKDCPQIRLFVVPAQIREHLIEPLLLRLSDPNKRQPGALLAHPLDVSLINEKPGKMESGLSNRQPPLERSSMMPVPSGCEEPDTVVRYCTRKRGVARRSSIFTSMIEESSNLPS
jgi:hypothetical protein